jgi:hypothetical protein
VVIAFDNAKMAIRVEKVLLSEGSINARLELDYVGQIGESYGYFYFIILTAGEMKIAVSNLAILKEDIKGQKYT